VGRHHRLVPRFDEAIEPRLAEEQADAPDQIYREVAMRVGKAAVPLCGQVPEAFRATNFTGLVVKPDKTLDLQLGEVLAGPDRGDAKRTRQRAGRQRTARLERIEEPIAAIRRHARNLLRNELLF